MPRITPLRSALLSLSLMVLAACSGGGDNDFDGDGTVDSQDCGSTDDSIYPGAPDPLNDDIDQNCDGVDGVDFDQDGYAAGDALGDDCNDLDADIHPGAEEVPNNNIDEDCDGIDGWYLPDLAKLRLSGQIEVGEGTVAGSFNLAYRDAEGETLCNQELGITGSASFGVGIAAELGCAECSGFFQIEGVTPSEIEDDPCDEGLLAQQGLDFGTRMFNASPEGSGDLLRITYIDPDTGRLAGLPIANGGAIDYPYFADAFDPPFFFAGVGYLEAAPDTLLAELGDAYGGDPLPGGGPWVAALIFNREDGQGEAPTPEMSGEYGFAAFDFAVQWPPE